MRGEDVGPHVQEEGKPARRAEEMPESAQPGRFEPTPQLRETAAPSDGIRCIVLEYLPKSAFDGGFLDFHLPQDGVEKVRAVVLRKFFIVLTKLRNAARCRFLLATDPIEKLHEGFDPPCGGA